MMDFDEILEVIGEFGRYQITNYLLICLPVLFSAANSLTYVFTAGVPKYRCFVPGCDDEVNPNFSEYWVSQAIPPSDHESDISGVFIPDQCLMYKTTTNNSKPNFCPLDYFSTQTIKCNSWVFEENERTIVGEWNITCLENQWKLSLVGTVHFAGILMGSVVFGLLADKFGRKLIFIFSIILMSITGIAQAVSTDYIMFQVFVFINALGTAGVYPLAFILGVELVGKQKREMSGIILNYFYAIGEASVGLLAWFTKDWVAIQLAVSAPPALFILYYWLVPESVRWLLAQRKHHKAVKIVKKAAKVNKVVLSQELLSSFDDASKQSKGQSEELDIKKEVGILQSIKEICKSRKLYLRSLNLFYTWAANAFVYYGLSVNSTSLGGSKYLNFALVCLIEIPGYTAAWILMNKVGRRWSLFGSLLLCSVTCIAAAFVPQDMHWAVVILFLVGKLGITSSFGIIVVYTAELYPTVMRSIGVGASSTVARVGAMVAPFAPLLGIYMESLPLLLFGAVSFIAALLSLMYPETLGTRLPDSIEELERL